jgi:16S rRNA (guanine527-N7)-methyltransferase
MTADTPQLLIDLAATHCALTLTGAQAEQLLAYRDFLLAWNTHTNLTAIRDPQDFLIKHLLDSFHILRCVPPQPGQHWVDVGSGAGLPGLVLKILQPTIQLTLVESTGKKCTFLQAASAQLGLTGVQVRNMRAEEAGQLPDLRERADWAIARAVARLPILLEYLLPLVRSGGGVIAMKGSDTVESELADSGSALRTLRGRLRQRFDYSLPDVAMAHSLLVFDKVGKTPMQYPRPIGTPAKQPLG